MSTGSEKKGCASEALPLSKTELVDSASEVKYANISHKWQQIADYSNLLTRECSCGGRRPCTRGPPRWPCPPPCRRPGSKLSAGCGCRTCTGSWPCRTRRSGRSQPATQKVMMRTIKRTHYRHTRSHNLSVSPARTGPGQCSPSTSCGWCRRSTGGRTGPASLRPAAGTTAASISREKQRLTAAQYDGESHNSIMVISVTG